MAQADEMGEGEVKDDGFVDCPPGSEGMRRRNKKRPGKPGKSRWCNDLTRVRVQRRSDGWMGLSWYERVYMLASYFTP